MLREVLFIVNAILVPVVVIAQNSNVSRHEAEFQNGERLEYQLFLPDGYEEKGTESFPFLLFLHGGGESGQAFEKISHAGPFVQIREGVKLPFIVVAPQLPEPLGFWDESEISLFLDQLEDQLRIDSDRVYLTGLSRGGYGVWRVALENPNRFAAMVTISGVAPSPYAGWLRDLPTRIYHGELDQVVPVGESRRMVSEIQRRGGNAELIVYPEAKHDAWTQTYANLEIYDWLLSNDLSQRKMVFPGEEWAIATPQEQGIDHGKMMAALKVLESYCGEDGLRQAMLIRNGRVVFSGDNIERSHNIYSSTKSFTSTVLGLLVEEGKCRLDSKAADFEPLLQQQYPEVTLRQFATMTSGYSAVGKSRWNEASEDWSKTPFHVAQPLFEPGTAYAYWDEAMMMFGRVLTRVAGENLYDYFDRKVAQRIGLGEWRWWSEERFEDGTPMVNGCTGIALNASQLARMGHLFLNEGNWKGKQVVPNSWVRVARESQVSGLLPIADTDRADVVGSGLYGFNWWVRGGEGDMEGTPAKTYYMSGFNNNMCFVIPEWDMVFVRMGEDGNPEEGKRFVYNEFFAALSEAMK